MSARATAAAGLPIPPPSRASERIAAALERAWPPVDLSGEPPDEQDFITAADHEPDEQALRQRVAQLVAQGREAELEELMTSALGGDE